MSGRPADALAFRVALALYLLAWHYCQCEWDWDAGRRWSEVYGHARSTLRLQQPDAAIPAIPDELDRFHLTCRETLSQVIDPLLPLAALASPTQLKMEARRILTSAHALQEKRDATSQALATALVVLVVIALRDSSGRNWLDVWSDVHTVFADEAARTSSLALADTIHQDTARTSPPQRSLFSHQR